MEFTKFRETSNVKHETTPQYFDFLINGKFVKVHQAAQRKRFTPSQRRLYFQQKPFQRLHGLYHFE
jgi:hypothetical protein